MAVPLFLIGFIFSFPALMDIGIIAFSLAVLFQLVTLPVEFDASKRAANLLVGANIVSDTEEINSVKKVLNAAALTYVAAASVAVFQLLRLIVLRNRR
jgi:Zn-dependent membrane protease YugP